MRWYEKYLPVYEKPYDAVSAETFGEIRRKMEALQSDEPLVSVVIIAWNEEERLTACLWSLADSVCKYPMEIVGVNNNSTDRTAEVYRRCGVEPVTETRQSCGYARQCGLEHARGRFIICIDADTLYPPRYVETMTRAMLGEGVVGVYSLWSFIPDEAHSRFSLWFYEWMRDTHLRLKSIKQPEMCVRGMVFAHDTEFARRIGYRVDIKRGEDGSMAWRLKEYGRLKMLHSRRARAVTGCRSIGDGDTVFQSLKSRVVKEIRQFSSYFTRIRESKDDDSNLIK